MSSVRRRRQAPFQHDNDRSDSAGDGADGESDQSSVSSNSRLSTATASTGCSLNSGNTSTRAQPGSTAPPSELSDGDVVSVRSEEAIRADGATRVVEQTVETVEVRTTVEDGNGGAREEREYTHSSVSKRLFTYSHSPNVRSSILEEEERPVGWGFFNFCAIGVAMFTLHLMIDNLHNGKPAVDWAMMLWILTDTHIAIALWLLMAGWSFATFGVVKLMAINIIGSRVCLGLYACVQLVLFVGPTYAVLHSRINPLMAAGTIMQLCAHAMKIHSYWHTNWLLNQIHTENKMASPLKHIYPKNVSLGNYAYFLVAPTIVYEPVFPRTSRVRPRHLIKYFSLAGGTFFVVYMLLVEFVRPVYHQVENESYIRLIVRLGVPTMMLWMLLFYGVFHCVLNGIAEATRFADRRFYLDWWNAVSFDDWYRKWNLPVHEFMLRHVYSYTLDRATAAATTAASGGSETAATTRQVRAGSSAAKRKAAFATFFFSAVLHEFVLITAFGMFRPFLGLSMLAQIGLIYLTRLEFVRSNHVLGNCILWLCLWVGFPMVEFAYIQQWVVQNDFAPVPDTSVYQLPIV